MDPNNIPFNTLIMEPTNFGKTKCGFLKWPQLLQVDRGREFIGTVTKEMEKHKTNISHRCTEIH